jgi:peptidoglycan/LPS O-acetylase OafA/YrhL
MRLAVEPVTHSKYLAQLDGLRAIALLGVLAFHFQVKGAEHGFLGVDVFFTLSGFIITRKIVSDIDSASFSFTRFYTRRFFRLFPALLAVTLFSLLGTYLTLPPEISKSVAISSIAAIFSCSNMYFLLTSNYFDTTAQYKPLLHTWSLSLEEQFYLIWPLILWISYRRNHVLNETKTRLNRMTRTICAALIFSFIIHCFLYRSDANADFYLILTRVYQFALGALCVNLEKNMEARPLLKEFLFVSGILWILASFFLGYERGTFQGLIVSVASAAVILSHGSQLGQITMGNPICIYIGKVSYSAYLVHWTLWVLLTQVYAALGTGKPDFARMVVLTSLLAVCLNKLVEVPLRKEQTSATIIVLVVLTAITIVFALYGYYSDGWQARRPNWKTQPKWGSDYLHFCRDEKDVSSSPTSSRCTVGLKRLSYKYDGIIIGNSFARHLIGALNILSARNQSFLVIHRSGCDFSVERVPDFGMSACQQWNDESIKLLQSLPATHLYFCSMWSEDMINSIPSLKEFAMKSGHKSVFVSTTPGRTSRNACRDLELMPLGKLIRPKCPTSHRVSKNFIATHHKFLRKLRETSEGELFVDLFKVFCGVGYSSSSACSTSIEEEGKVTLLFLRDGFHLTLAGSEIVGKSGLLIENLSITD